MFLRLTLRQATNICCLRQCTDLSQVEAQIPYFYCTCQILWFTRSPAHLRACPYHCQSLLINHKMSPKHWPMNSAKSHLIQCQIKASHTWSLRHKFSVISKFYAKTSAMGTKTTGLLQSLWYFLTTSLLDSFLKQASNDLHQMNAHHMLLKINLCVYPYINEKKWKTPHPFILR